MSLSHASGRLKCATSWDWLEENGSPVDWQLLRPSHSHTLTQVECVLVWRSADLNWFWRSESYMGATIQYTGGRVHWPITTFSRNWAIKRQTQTQLRCQIVAQHGHCMQIWWHSPTKILKGATLENWLLTPTVVIEEYTPQFWRFVNSLYAFRLLIHRAIQKCILCWGSIGKVRLQKQWKPRRQYSPPVAWLALSALHGGLVDAEWWAVKSVKSDVLNVVTCSCFLMATLQNQTWHNSVSDFCRYYTSGPSWIWWRESCC